MGNFCRKLKFSLAILILNSTFLVFLIFCFEMYYRVIKSPEPYFLENSRLEISPDFGWDSIPQVEKLHDKEAEATNVKTIVFIGDSFTQGTQWAHMTIDSLSKAKVNIRGYSFGVAGYGTIQSFLKLRALYDQYKPDVVVLLFFAWNDLRDNFNYPAIYYNPRMRSRPYFSFSNAPYVINYPSQMPQFISDLKVYERYILVIETRLAYFLVDKLGMDEIAKRRIPLKLSYTAFKSWIGFYIPALKNKTYVAQAWEATEVALVRLNTFLKNQGAQLIVLGIDNAFTVDQDVFDVYLSGFEDVDVSFPLEKLGKVLHKNGIRYINCLPYLKAYAKTKQKKIYNGPPGNLSGHLGLGGEKIITALAYQEILANFTKTQGVAR